MAVARVFAWHPNGTTEEFGALDERAALSKFDSFPWDRYLREAEELDRKGVDCVDADLTFRIGDCHFMARIKQADSRSRSKRGSSASKDSSAFSVVLSAMNSMNSAPATRERR